MKEGEERELRGFLQDGIHIILIILSGVGPAGYLTAKVIDH